MKMNMPNVMLKTAFIYCTLIVSILGGGFIQASVRTPHLNDKNKVDINVGIYAPFSDKSAFIGRNILAAMEMGRDQLKSSRINYTFYTLDELPNQSNVTQTLQKFITTHHINVLMTEGSENGLLIAPLARKNNILHFSLANDPAIADGKNNFLAWSPAYEQAAVLVEELQRKKVGQIGIITLKQPSSMVLTQSVMKQLQIHSSIKIAAYEQIDPGVKDVYRLIQRMEDKKPDMYFIMASPEDIEFIQSEMSKAHVNKPITSIIGRVTPQVMKVFDGQWYIDTHEMKAEFIQQFKTHYLNYPVTEAGYAFDVFHILNQSVTMVLKTKHGFSSKEVANQIHLLAKGTGVMGPFNLDKNGVLFTKSEIKTIKDGHVLTV
ncbi:leucine-, isoleucine-, valine-, threonine-, and alanine-binding protein [Legionella quateirensis]|uniref:Leucine-, isoleucine-, valine-, threonine-, and alanine-binding protein n=2 Tax=Legionella quateirensis TaxID=45072 RepID=A0ABR5RRZ2_9GAMM|nr:leucine-, isoleucine-, valine-, threonine-, and alanine-binding protein [Legionella quateirensis]